MQDMLVKLYDLPPISDLESRIRDISIVIRRPLAAEKSIVTEWVKRNFGSGWASEVEVSFSFHPISCYIAIHSDQIIGFASYDCAYKNFFGPTGVIDDHRNKGIGKTLLLKCLYAWKELGYAYGIIGGVGPAEYYEKVVKATLIDGSDPGIYDGILSDIPVK